MTATYTTTHEGQTATRKSAGHTQQEYRYAIWVLCVDRGKTEPTWGCEAYASRADLAQNRAREFERCSWVNKVAIEPVTCVIKLTKKQQIWAATEGLPPQERLAEYYARLKA